MDCVRDIVLCVRVCVGVRWCGGDGRYLIKLGGTSLGLKMLKRWTRRYFVLSGPILRYWETKADRDNGGLGSVRASYELDGTHLVCVRLFVAVCVQCCVRCVSIRVVGFRALCHRNVCPPAQVPRWNQCAYPTHPTHTRLSWSRPAACESTWWRRSKRTWTCGRKPCKAWCPRWMPSRRCTWHLARLGAR